MAELYEKAFHYIIDDFSRGMDEVSAPQNMDDRSFRYLDDAFIGQDKTPVQRMGMFPVCMCSIAYIEDIVNTSYAPFIHMIRGTGTQKDRLMVVSRDYHCDNYAYPPETHVQPMWFDYGSIDQWTLPDTFTEETYLPITDASVMTEFFGRAQPDVVIQSSVYAPGAYCVFFNGNNVMNNACSTGGKSLMTFVAGGSVFTAITPSVAYASLWADDVNTYIEGIAAWKGRLWVADTQKRIFFSGILDHASWDAVDYIEIEGMDAGDFTCLMANGEKLIAATTERKYAIIGDTPNDFRVVALEGRGIARTPTTFSWYTDAVNAAVRGTSAGTFRDGAKPLACLDPRGNLYYIAPDGEFYLFDGYHEYPLSRGRIPTHITRGAISVMYHDWRVYISVCYVVPDSNTYWVGEVSTVTEVTYVYDLRNGTFTVMEGAYIAGISTGMVGKSDGLLLIPLQRNVTHMGVGYSATVQEERPAAHVVHMAANKWAGYEVDQKFYYKYDYRFVVPDWLAYGWLISDVRGVTTTVITKDIDMGLPDRYKLFKTLLFDVELVNPDVEAAKNVKAAFYTQQGEEWSWSIAGQISVFMSVDGGDYVDLGDYTFTVKSGSVEIDLTRHGQVRLIPPTYGAVMGRTVRIKFICDRCIIRRVDLEYAIRSSIPPATTNTLMQY